jgi:DNA-directed RNA polymerase specialized sigma24 family protein
VAELRIALLRAMARLSAGQREVVICHDVLGMKHEEIAYVLGCAVGTSKAQLHRARLQLRALLGGGNGNGGGGSAKSGNGNGNGDVHERM